MALPGEGRGTGGRRAITVSGATSLTAAAINNWSTVVGFYTDAQGNTNGLFSLP